MMIQPSAVFSIFSAEILLQQSLEELLSQKILSVILFLWNNVFVVVCDRFLKYSCIFRFEIRVLFTECKCNIFVK